MRPLKNDEAQFIREAADYLEKPHFIHRLSQILGTPLEKSLHLLPPQAQGLIANASQKAIETALKAGLATISKGPKQSGFLDSIGASRKTALLHGISTAVSGAAGGLFGLPALAVELPITTTVMLRSISRIAADFGEDLGARETQLECLYIFSLGSPLASDDASESAYYASRIAFSQMITHAVHFLAGKTTSEIAKEVEKKAAPVLVEFIVRVASRFELVVSRKALGQLIPGIGAGVGAALNAAFSEHFNQVARYHFGLRRLERDCGRDVVERYYRR